MCGRMLKIYFLYFKEVSVMAFAQCTAHELCKTRTLTLRTFYMKGGGRCWMYIAYPSFFLIQTHKVIKDGFKLV